MTSHQHRRSVPPPGLTAKLGNTLIQAANHRAPGHVMGKKKTQQISNNHLCRVLFAGFKRRRGLALLSLPTTSLLLGVLSAYPNYYIPLLSESTTIMPVLSRIVSPVLRVAEIFFGAVRADSLPSCVPKKRRAKLTISSQLPGRCRYHRSLPGPLGPA